jgi:hypothetical protein
MKRFMEIAILTITVLTIEACAGPPPPPVPPLGPGLDWLVPLAIVGFAAYWITRRAKQRKHGGSGSDRSRAAQILRERYAKGEVSRDEFLRIGNDLGEQDWTRGKN